MSQVILGNQKLRFIKGMFYAAPPPPPPEKYLTIEALDDNFYISYTDYFSEMFYTEEEIQELCNETGWEYEKMQYSFDKINWYILEPWGSSPSINAGEKIYLKRRFITPGLYNETYSSLTHISCEGQHNLSGNCNSILFGDSNGELFDGCFCELFESNWDLINISESFLPATTLADGCYSSMFNECTSLVTAPELPATTLASSCYSNMFYNCTSLTTLPTLPATTLADGCYSSMFNECTSLVTAPALPATTLVEFCYNHMFYGCTSLVTAPELPATTLVELCYNYMFCNCSKLNYIKALFTSTPGSSYTSNWVNGVSRTGTFVKNKDATWNVTGLHGIPSGWTVQTT